MRLREMKKVLEIYDKTKKSAKQILEGTKMKLKPEEVRKVLRIHRGDIEVTQDKIGAMYTKCTKAPVKKATTPKKEVSKKRLEDHVVFEENPYGFL